MHRRPDRRLTNSASSEACMQHTASFLWAQLPVGRGHCILMACALITIATLQAAARLLTTLTGLSVPCRDAQHAVRQPGSHLDHAAVPERCIPKPLPPGRLAVPEHPVGRVRSPDSAFVRQACALAKAVQACIRAARCAGMNPPACPYPAGRCMPGSDACRAGLEVWLPADARLLGGAELHDEQRMVLPVSWDKGCHWQEHIDMCIEDIGWLSRIVLHPPH